MSPFSPDATARELPAVAPDSARMPMGPPVAEWRSAEFIATFEPAWAALASRALEPNVFLEPGFAIPAARHFAPSQRPDFLLVWAREASGAEALIGLCALQTPRRFRLAEMSTAWTHEQATLSAPLLDRDRAADALAAMLAGLAARSSDWSGLLLRGVPIDGPLMRLLSDSRATQVIEVERRTRAVLRRAGSPRTDATVPTLAPKRAKELRRQRRRLADDGPCTFTSARDIDDVKLATERFLELEARGWKGGRGTALLNDPGLATFTRAMTRRLARQGLCRIDSLDVGGRPAAMGIVLTSGDRSYFWKTAYDQTRHRQSPGKQFTLALRGAQLADPAVALTDSCAVPDHPMIDGLWSDRMIVADLLVAGSSTPDDRLAKAARMIGLWRRGRGLAKAAGRFVRDRFRTRGRTGNSRP